MTEEPHDDGVLIPSISFWWYSSTIFPLHLAHLILLTLQSYSPGQHRVSCVPEIEEIMMAPEMLTSELNLIPLPTLAKLREDLGMQDKDVITMTPEEKMQLVHLFYWKTMNLPYIPDTSSMPHADVVHHEPTDILPLSPYTSTMNGSGIDFKSEFVPSTMASTRTPGVMQREYHDHASSSVNAVDASLQNALLSFGRLSLGSDGPSTISMTVPAPPTPNASEIDIAALSPSAIPTSISNMANHSSPPPSRGLNSNPPDLDPSMFSLSFDELIDPGFEQDFAAWFNRPYE